MTYEQRLQELHEEFAKCGSALAEAQKIAESTQGFGDFNEAPNYIKAHNEWQQAGKRYHEFEAYLRTQVPELRHQQMP